MDLDTFAAQRDEDLVALADEYAPAVDSALQEQASGDMMAEFVTALTILFLLTYGEEGGEESQEQKYLALFLAAMEAVLPETDSTYYIDYETEEEAVAAQEAQVARISNWFSTATLGAATLYAAESTGTVQTKTWVTMRDDAVRDTHAPLDGETKEINDFFTVKTTPPAQMQYPGEPVGPVDAWINCRCVLSIGTVVASGAYDGRMDPNLVASGGFSGVVLVALPAGDQRVTYEDGDSTELHQTLAYLGSTDQMQEGEREAVLEVAERMAARFEPFTARVSGRGTLGEDQDEIVLTEADELQAMHNFAIDGGPVMAMYEERNGHPTWISHITGSDAQAGDEIPMNRIGAWFGGDDHHTFNLGEPVTEEPLEDDVTEDDDAPPIPDEPIPAEDQNQPVYGVAVPEGVESGDKRMFAPGGITHRDLPLTLTWQRASASEHEGEVVVGRLDTLELRDDDMWHYTGELLTDVPETDEVINLIAQGALRGVSIAGDKGKVAMPTDAEMEQALDGGEEPTTVFEEARISGLTIVQIPAFQESFISLGVDPELSEPLAAAAEIETFKRGTGWVTHPEETSRLHRYWTKGKGAAKIRWGTGGDFTRCTRQLRKYIEPRFLNRTCAEWHHDALGYWPGELGKPGNNPKNSLEPCTDCEDTAMIAASASIPEAAPALTIVAAAPPAVVNAAWFADPKFSAPTALVVDKAGRVFGHIAKWGTCHIGIEGQCVTPPTSKSNYAHFHLGAVESDEGTLAVGTLTLGTGHADLHLSGTDTRRHYDHTGTAVAKVRAGEDAHGIWVAGSLCDGVTDEQRRTLMAAGGISGDWRSIGGALELVAGLAVNVPGFPVPRPALAASGGHQESLVAAGVVIHEPDPSIDAIADAVVAKLAAKQKRAERLADLLPLRTEVRARRIAKIAASAK